MLSKHVLKCIVQHFMCEQKLKFFHAQTHDEARIVKEVSAISCCSVAPRCFTQHQSSGEIAKKWVANQKRYPRFE